MNTEDIKSVIKKLNQASTTNNDLIAYASRETLKDLGMTDEAIDKMNREN